MKVQIEIDENELRAIVLDYIRARFRTEEIDPADVAIEVKSKNNYRSEWERAAFRARVDKVVP